MAASIRRPEFNIAQELARRWAALGSAQLDNITYDDNVPFGLQIVAEARKGQRTSLGLVSPSLVGNIPEKIPHSISGRYYMPWILVSAQGNTTILEGLLHKYITIAGISTDGRKVAGDDSKKMGLGLERSVRPDLLFRGGELIVREVKEGPRLGNRFHFGNVIGLSVCTATETYPAWIPPTEPRAAGAS